MFKPEKAPKLPLPTKAFVDQQRAVEASPSAATKPEPKMTRSYLVWPARNTFCCWGHLMTGPPEDLLPNTCAWVTILVPMTLFLYTWSGTLMRSSPPLLCFVLACFSSTIFWFLVTTFSDPGILPRNTEPPGRPAPPLYRERIDDAGAIVTDTWCHTCRIYRPPRASHCSDCDNCVRDFDHHCPFTRNCIGARNYSSFIAFLMSVSVSLGALLISCLMLSGVPVPDASSVELTPEQLAVEQAMLGFGPIFNTALIVFAVVLSLPLWTFTGYHVTLVRARRALARTPARRAPHRPHARRRTPPLTHAGGPARR